MQSSVFLKMKVLISKRARAVLVLATALLAFSWQSGFTPVIGQPLPQSTKPAAATQTNSTAPALAGSQNFDSVAAQAAAAREADKTMKRFRSIVRGSRFVRHGLKAGGSSERFTTITIIMGKRLRPSNERR